MGFLNYYKWSLLGVLLIISPLLAAQVEPLLEQDALIKVLRSGGYTIYFRHEATNWSQLDNVNAKDDWLSCDGRQMRQLSDAGRKSAVATGRAIRKLRIPVTRIFSSPYCRTIETASLMNLGKVQPTAAVMNMRVAEYHGGRSAIIKTAQALLSTPPIADGNTLIVAHGNVAQAATPIYPGEGEGVIFQPDMNEGFRYIGRLTSNDWVQLSEAKIE